MSVDNIIAEHERNSQPGLFHCNPLKLLDIIHGIGIEYISTPSTADIIEIAFTDRRSGHIPITGKKDHLTDLLVKGHDPYKGIYSRIYILERSLPSASAGSKEQDR